MSAFIIVEINIIDSQRYEGYKQLVPPSLTAYGGRFAVRGGKTETLEGNWSPERLVVIEFPTVEQARAWWNSPEYAEAKALRQATARTKMILVEGA
jgi:uncharacterized protein (DUF1330 family)